MRQRFKDSEHLLRLAGLFAAGVALFFVARSALIPEGFGEYGHYRPGALQDNREKHNLFAGAAACADCHDVTQALSAGKHASVHCEACHGALSAHASDPAKAAAKRPDPRLLCPVCHARNVAKPAQFPQVDPQEHAGGASCTDCHDPHSPGMG
ncbi:MAG: hypothetical protein ACM30E_07815 [Nitrososphaerales archaeon]